MGGLLLIVLVLFYVSIVLWMLIKIRPWWGKILVLIVAVLIPTADDYYYKHQLARYCETEAGYDIYSHASKESGLFHNGYIGHPDHLELVPLRFVEFYDSVADTIVRYERQESGDIETIVTSNIASSFDFFRKEAKEPPFLKTELLIVERKSGEVFGRLTDVNYYGGWFSRNLLGSIADSGPTLVADCGINDAQDMYKLINKVFSLD